MEGLIWEGLCREIGHGPSTGGKSPILLEVPDEARVLIGVDLGDRVFTAATINLRGQVLNRVDVPSGSADGDDAIGLALDVIRQALGHKSSPALGPKSGPILGIGIGAPGLVDATTGTVIQSVSRNWRNLPLGPLVKERFGLRVHVANDCQAAVLAEHVFGAMRGPNLITVKAGQGIGAGLVLNGELFEGDGYGAGEIGHTIVDERGELCRCGRRGCLETVASVPAILAELSALAGHPVTLDEALSGFRLGDPQVREVVLKAGRKLGAALAWVVGTLHVRRFILAGNMAAFGQGWLDAVATASADRALGPLSADTTFELGGIDDVVVLGASALLMTRELGLTLRPFQVALHQPERSPND
jgi:predicted NBD/HSP70 family sugar kinase